MKKFLTLITLVSFLVAGASATQLFTSDNFQYSDNFEDDQFPYSVEVGSSSEFTETSNASYTSSTGLEIDGFTEAIAMRESGSEFVQGQTYAGYVNMQSGSNDSKILFGSNGDRAYSLAIKDGIVQLLDRDIQDYNPNIIDEANVSDVTDKWLRYEIHWEKDGTITAQVYDETDGSKVAEVSGQETLNSVGGSVAFGVYNTKAYFDSLPYDHEFHEYVFSTESAENGANFNLNPNLQTNEKYQFRLRYRTLFGFFDSPPEPEGYLYCGDTFNYTVTENSFNNWMERRFTETVGESCNSITFEITNDGSGELDVELQAIKAPDDEDPTANPWLQDWTGDAQLLPNNGNPLIQEASGTSNPITWDGDINSDWTMKGTFEMGNQSETDGYTQTSVQIDNEMYVRFLSDGDVYLQNTLMGNVGSLTGTNDYSISVEQLDPDGAEVTVRVNGQELTETDGSSTTSWGNPELEIDSYYPIGEPENASQQSVLYTDTQIYDTAGYDANISVSDSDSQASYCIDESCFVNSLDFESSITATGPGITSLNYSRSTSQFESTSFNPPVEDASYEVSSILGSEGEAIGWQVYDDVDLVFADDRVIYVDDSAPTIQSGGHSGTIDRNGIFQISATDDEAIKYINFYAGQAILSPDPDNFVGRIEYDEVRTDVTAQKSIDNLPVGQSVNWIAEVVDGTGKTDTRISSYDADGAPPQIGDYSIEINGQQVQEGDTFYLNDDYSLDASVDVSDDVELRNGWINDPTFNQSLSGTSDTITLTDTVPTSQEEVTATVEDWQGKTTSETVVSYNIIDDSTAPSLDNTTAIRDGRNITVETTVSDQYPDTITFNLLDRSHTVDISENGTYSHIFTNVPEQQYNWENGTSTTDDITVEATDRSGNTNTDSPDAVVVDETDPEISADIEQVSYGTVEISNINYSDNVGFAYFEVVNNGENLGTFCNVDADGDGYFLPLGEYAEGGEFPTGQETADTDAIVGDFYGAGNCDYRIGGYPFISISEDDTGTFTDDLEDMNEVTLVGHDVRNNESYSETIEIERGVPGVEDWSVENLDGPSGDLEANDTFRLTVNFTEEVQNVASGVYLDGISIVSEGLQSTPELTNTQENTWVLETSLFEITDVEAGADCIHNGDLEFLESCISTIAEGSDGEVEEAKYFSFIIEYTDQFGFERNTQELKSDLIWDNFVDFRNWKALSSPTELDIQMSFDSSDDLQQIDTEIFDETDLRELEFYNLDEDCGIGPEYCSVFANDTIQVTNTANYTQLVYYKDLELGRLEANESLNFSREDYQEGIFGAEPELSDIRSEFRSEIIINTLSRSNWNRDGEQYSGDLLVNEPGTYNIRLNVSDSKGNFKIIERSATVRPTGLAGQMYQTFHNSTGYPDWVLATIFYIPIVLLGGLWARMRTGVPIVFDLWVATSSLLLMISGALAFTIHIMLPFTIAMIVVNQGLNIWSGS